MKILTFTTLYPNAAQPNHCVFVENRLRQLTASRQVESQVLAPVPWFPLRHPYFGRYATFARVPAVEVRHGIKISHPRYAVLPKFGMSVTPFLLAAAMRPVVQNMIREGYDFDLIDAHYFYPDGVAAAMLGRYFNKPVVITARGTDITLIPRFSLPRKMILWAADQAAAMITVCHALKSAMLDLGISGKRIEPLRNGVDLNVFHPIDRARRRNELGLKRFTLLSVGNLNENKGHGLIIEALTLLPHADLMIAGIGGDRADLESLAKRLNVADRVTFLGSVPHTELKQYYGAADALVLASKREGWPNVLLESMACGTPVVANNAWGIPEVVTSEEAGVLMLERSPQGIAGAVQALCARYPKHEATRRYAENFSWEETTKGQIALFKKILRERRS